MSAFRVLGFSCWFFLLAVSPLFAQEARIRIVQSGGDPLLEDLKNIVTLTPNKQLQKEWKNLHEILDGFLLGIHRTQPMRIDLVIAPDASGKSSLSYEPSFPIFVDKNGKEKFDGKDSFLENLKGLGYKVKKVDGDLYEIVESGVKGAKPMFLRHIHGYAVISSSKTALPATLPKPILDVQHLLNAGYDVAAELKNTADGAAQRREEFQSLRKELEAAIKFKRNEEKSEFELRKLGVTQFLDEVERFLVESELLVAGWTTQPEAKLGQAELKLTALADTSLLASIQLLAVQPNYFANVKLHPREIVSGKLTFPFDELRKSHAQARNPLLRTVTKASIEKSATMSAERKAAASAAFDKLVDIFDASLGIGLEGFIDLHGDEHGNQVGVAGLRGDNAKLVDDIIELLPKISDKWQVKLKAHEHGGVTIHEVTISEKYKEEFEALFGKETIFYIGSSQKAVWGAAGVGSLAELKQAIDDQAQPMPAQPDPDFATITLKFGPLVKLIDAIEKKIVLPASATKQEVQQKKERDRLRQLALEAFATGDEVLTGKMTRQGDAIHGVMTVNQGIFRFIGSAIADFSKQNLK